MMFKTIGVLLGAFLIFGVLMLAGCGSDDNPVNSVDSKTYVHVPFPDGSYFARARSISVTATGSGITTPITVKDTTIVGSGIRITQSDISLAVPSGANRHFDILASDSLGQNLYRTQFDATVNSGGRTDLSAILMPVGYGTPTKVKIFRDDIPWSAGPQTDSVVIAAGFTEGLGVNQYQILASSSMGSVTLNPRENLVIIEADQDTTFYQNYLNAHGSFNSFVEQGGTILYIFAINNAVYNRISMIFPDSVTFAFETDGINNTLINDHPINIGQDETMVSDWASHGYFTNLASHSLVLNTNSSDSAVTVIYNYGAGTVVLSSQTLELTRHERTPTMGPILSKTIRFLLGLDPTPEPLPRDGNPIAGKVSTNMN